MACRPQKSCSLRNLKQLRASSAALPTELSSSFTYIFVVAATVPAEASQAAVEHLDAAERHLQHAHAQQNGEQDHVPHHGVFGQDTLGPHGLVDEVAAIGPAGREQQQEHCKGHTFSINENNV